MVKPSLSNAGGVGSIPGRGAKILSAKKTKHIKQKRYCNKFNKDFKNGPHQKKSLKKSSKEILHSFIHTIDNILYVIKNTYEMLKSIVEYLKLNVSIIQLSWWP